MQEPRPKSEKIQDIEVLSKTVADLKRKGKRVVHCHGVFDLLHIGHIRHFEKAREFGDVLVVTLTPDQWVNKGPHRPAFTQSLRAESLASLQFIDFVAVNKWPNAVETIALLKPDFYCKGSDYQDAGKDVTGGIKLERDAVEAAGGKLVFTNEETFSSSTLLNRHMSTLPPAAAEFIPQFSKRHSIEQVIGYLENSRKLKVLLIGETIIDEYHYCQTLGKSGKEPILAVRFDSAERFAGGILAIANHVASFCDSVDVITSLGKQNTEESFVRERLAKNVNPKFLYMDGAPTIVKRRFIETYPFQKMFEVYFLNEDESEKANTARLCEMLEASLPEYDLVIVADYGHGMLAHDSIEVLCEKSRCLAVNTQTNAGNHGFNTVSKYYRADYVSVSEGELRLEARKRRGDLNAIIEAIADRLAVSKMMVTQGSQGLVCYTKGQGYERVPAFVTHFADRVGAGDAVFGITSLCMAQGAPGEILALIGNAVGAMAVTTIGNRNPVDRAQLVKSLTAILK